MKLPLLVTRLPQFPLPIPVVKFNLVGLMPQQGPPPVVVVVDPVMVVVVDPPAVSSLFTSAAKLSTFVSMVPWSTVVRQSAADVAFVQAAPNAVCALPLHAVSSGSPLLAAFE